MLDRGVHCNNPNLIFSGLKINNSHSLLVLQEGQIIIRLQAECSEFILHYLYEYIECGQLG